MENLGESIKNARKNKHLSQKEIADAIGVSQAAYSKWELGKSWPTKQNLKDLRAVLGCNFSGDATTRDTGTQSIAASPGANIHGSFNNTNPQTPADIVERLFAVIDSQQRILESQQRTIESLTTKSKEAQDVTI